MSDTLLDYDPNDTGDIPLYIPGETTHHITAADRERIVGETTQNLGHEIAGLPPRRRPDATGKLPALIDVPLGMTIGTDGVLDLAAAHPIAPWERVVDTDRLTILGSIAPAAELATPPASPPPLPPPPRPAAPGKGRGYVGRHRAVVEGTSWWPLIGLVAGAVIALSGLLVML